MLRSSLRRSDDPQTITLMMIHSLEQTPCLLSLWISFHRCLVWHEEVVHEQINTFSRRKVFIVWDYIGITLRDIYKLHRHSCRVKYGNRQATLELGLMSKRHIYRASSNLMVDHKQQLMIKPQESRPSPPHTYYFTTISIDRSSLIISFAGAPQL